MSATGFHPEPSAKAPWTRTMVLTAAYAGDDAAKAAPVRRARIKRFMVQARCPIYPESGCSTERESVGLNSRIQELNCERAVTYHVILSDKLIQTLAVNDPLTVHIGVGAVIRARHISVNGHAKSYWFPVRSGAQDEMQIAGVKPIHNTASHSIEDRIFTADRPIAR